MASPPPAGRAPATRFERDRFSFALPRLPCTASAGGVRAMPASMPRPTRAADGEVAAAGEAVDAAKTAVTDAGALSADEKSAFNSAIAVIEKPLAGAEERMAAARARQRGTMAAGAKKLSAASPRPGSPASAPPGSAARRRRGPAPSREPRPLRPCGLKTAGGGGAHPVGGLPGGTLHGPDEEIMTPDTVVLHTRVKVLGSLMRF